MSRANSILVQTEVGPQINPPHILVCGQLIWGAIPKDHAVVHDSTVSNAQGFTHVVIGDEHANARVPSE